MQRLRAPLLLPPAVLPPLFSDDVEWVEVSGRASLLSYVITQNPLRGFEPITPVVELDEGPLKLDMPLQVCFHRRDEMTLPVFAPAGDDRGATK